MTLLNHYIIILHYYPIIILIKLKKDKAVKQHRSTPNRKTAWQPAGHPVSNHRQRQAHMGRVVSVLAWTDLCTRQPETEERVHVSMCHIHIHVPADLLTCTR